MYTITRHAHSLVSGKKDRKTDGQADRQIDKKTWCVGEINSLFATRGRPSRDDCTRVITGRTPQITGACRRRQGCLCARVLYPGLRLGLGHRVGWLCARLMRLARNTDIAARAKTYMAR